MIEAALMCLALNIYFEARSEPIQGQIAIAEVTLNRVASKHYPNDVCGVVLQENSDGCQFSWWCDGQKDEPDFDSKEWWKAQEYASIVLSGTIMLDVTEGATHYHATYVRPSWAKTKTKTTRIDRHIFYRWEKK